MLSAGGRSVSTGHERRGHLGCARPAAGGPAVGSAALGEVTRPALSLFPPSLCPRSLGRSSPQFALGAQGPSLGQAPGPGPAAGLPGRRWPGHHVARASSDQRLPSRKEALGPKSVDLGLLLFFPGETDLIKPRGKLELHGALLPCEPLRLPET